MRTDVLGVGFDDLTLEEAAAAGAALVDAGGFHYAVTPNPEFLLAAKHNPAFRQALLGADLVLADGVGVVYSAKILGRPLKGKVPGIDFAQRLLAWMARHGKRLFLLGAKPGVAELAAANLKDAHPGLIVCGTHDGYFREDGPVVEEIRAAAADVVFVCLGAPKQELWMVEHGPATGAHLMVGLGGALDGAGGEALGEILESTYNVHLLGIAENGFRHITNSKHAIASKADMNGLKMRVAGSQLLNRSYELWGADYTNANWSEVFTALQTGTYDGQENPLPTADAASIQEVQSYLTYWTGAYDCLFFCMNAELYNSLSPELQAIVDEAGQAACEYERELNRSQDQEIMDKWAEAGVEITELTPEAAAEFAEASAPVYDEFADELTPELIEAFTSVTQADAGTTEPAA